MIDYRDCYIRPLPHSYNVGPAKKIERVINLGFSRADKYPVDSREEREEFAALVRRLRVMGLSVREIEDATDFTGYFIHGVVYGDNYRGVEPLRIPPEWQY